MFKFNRFIVLNCAVALMAAQTLAGDPNAGKGPGKGHKTDPVRWEEIQARCANPGSFQEQIQPQNLVIQCSESRVSWVPAAPGEVPLPTYRTVTAAVSSHKWHVDQFSAEIPEKGKVGSCHRFKEMEQRMLFEVPISCGQALAIGNGKDGKGGEDALAYYCATILDSQKGKNPKLVEQYETGRMHSTCGDGGKDGKSGK